MGYARYYKIPDGLISIDITSTANIMSQGPLLVLLVTIGMALFITTKIFNQPDSIFHKLVNQYVYTFFPGSIILVFRHSESLVWYFILGLVGLFIFVDFIYPIFISIDKKGYKEKFIEAHKSNIRTKSGSLISFLGYGNYIAFGSLFLTLYAANSVGYHEAYMKKEYLITQMGGNNYAVVSIYYDKIVCCGIDKEKKEIKPSIIIFNKEKMNEKIFIRENIGPLKVGSY